MKNDHREIMSLLLDQYWDIAYAEGAEGRANDTESGIAELVRHSLDSNIDYLFGQDELVETLKEDIKNLNHSRDIYLSELEPPKKT